MLVDAVDPDPAAPQEITDPREVSDTSPAPIYFRYYQVVALVDFVQEFRSLGPVLHILAAGTDLPGDFQVANVGEASAEVPFDLLHLQPDRVGVNGYLSMALWTDSSVAVRRRHVEGAASWAFAPQLFAADPAVAVGFSGIHAAPEIKAPDRESGR